MRTSKESKHGFRSRRWRSCIAQGESATRVLMNSRFGLQNLSRSEAASIAGTALTGLLLSSAHPAGMAVSVVMPAIVMCQRKRRAAYAIAAVYYAAALWPIIPGARNFFGPDVSALVAIGLWVSASLLLALPWLLVWSPCRREAIWRAPV